MEGYSSLIFFSGWEWVRGPGLKISDVSALPDYFTGIALKSYNFLLMIFH